VTQREIGDAAAVSRSSAAAILAALKRDGMIRIDYKTIVVLKPERLMALLAN